jgi:serine/threonine-protein kinase
MIDPRTSRFWRLALQSGLIGDRGLSDCWEALPEERRAAADQLDRRLARQAIQLKLITLWQAQQLLVGRCNGFQVGRYVLMDLLGQGGMGRVYQAKDTALGRTVALKILSADRMKNPRAIARFQREAKVGAQLQHENLVRIYDFGESKGRHFLVMEYIEGRTIGSLIAQQGPIPPAIAAGLGRQVALGLEHAHKKALVHRDVNPYNIMVTYDGTAKLADLGLALDLTDTDRFTRDGATVGTFDYVAPEQARHSHSADIRSDIYSLGCTLYHMILGEVPFPTASLPEKLYAHQSVEPTPLDRIVPGIPEGLAEGIARMMRKVPDDRFTTPALVARMLEPFVETALPLDADRGGPTVPPQREVRPGPEAKTLLITTQPAVGAPTAANLASGHPTAEAAAPVWDFAAVLRGDPTPSGATASSPLGSVSASDPDLPLMLNLGPEPSLSEVLAESRKLPRSRSPTSSISGGQSPTARVVELWRRSGDGFPSPRLLLGGLFLATILAAGVIATFWLNRPVSNSPNPSRTGPGEAGSAAANPTIAASSAAAQAPIVVRPLDGTGPDFAAKTLPDAINRALGSGGVVVLRNRKPLELTNNVPVSAMLGGKLVIRAESELQPVLNITFNSPGPFLVGGPELTLELEGLTVRALGAKSSAPGARGFKSSTIIQAAGQLVVRRCEFRSEAGPDSALYCDGGGLTVERSRFEGFERAVEIRTFQKLAARIRQTSIVPGAERSGGHWGVKVSHFSSKGLAKRPDGSHLTLDHCTFQGAGLLALAGFSERSPLQIKMTNCQVRADALINWESKPGEPARSEKGMAWLGRGNQFEIDGNSLILQNGTPSDSSAMTSAIIDSVTPSTDGKAAGADPALIGPSSPARR